MSGNTFGHVFAVTNFGESHGTAIGCVIDGCPPGLLLTEADLQKDLDRRKPGTSRFVTQRQEDDLVKIVSGVFEGVTTGAPIALLIQNQDQRSKDYGDIAVTFRPGHADYTYWHKYGIRDYRGGGRTSARLTAPMVAAGGVAKKWLREHKGIDIKAYLAQIGSVVLPFESWDFVEQNPFFAANQSVIAQAETYLEDIRLAGNSCGALVKAVVSHMPVGLGQPLYDKLDADIAYAMMGINAVKAVSIGDGFEVVTQLGSEHGDELTPDGFKTNHAGGILGGVSTGQDLRIALAIKPTSSILIEKDSIDVEGMPVKVKTKGRHDPCVGIRAIPIVEAMLALVLMDHVLRNRAQCHGVEVQTPDIALNSPPGLLAIYEELTSFADVHVVAPERNHSGASSSLTLNLPLSVYQANWGPQRGFTYINGTPADCVHIALTGLLSVQPDLVVSGINHGQNMGEDVLYSGTVAAALEGYLCGVPAIALSQVDRGWGELSSCA
ncbi:unnamed protein product, partial [Darwinula stevensoni]